MQLKFSKRGYIIQKHIVLDRLNSVKSEGNFSKYLNHGHLT